MNLILTNALLMDLDPLRVEAGELRVEGKTITERGTSVSRDGEFTIVDCENAVVLPGMVNGHTHLYSALAAGMPAPPQTPQNFYEILKFVWWRLDRALDKQSIELSGVTGALAALKCGTTTLIDHHASPNCIDGSLDFIESGVDTVGLRLIQCYETTDRNGLEGRGLGLAENLRYLEKCQDDANGRFGALVGAHASFTCDDETMDEMSGMAQALNTGLHIHVAEDLCDENFCKRDHEIDLIDRLQKFNMLNPETIFGHCTHLDERAIAICNEAGVGIAHNTRSNMNNAVGYAPVGKFTCPIQLGTDGIGADMFAEAQTAWLKSCDGGGGLSPQTFINMLVNSARRASKVLGVTVGKLEVGAQADIIITDYFPATPLTTENAAGHFLFAMSSNQVRAVLVGGDWKMKAGKIVSCDEKQLRSHAIEAAKALWKRMGDLS